MSKALKGIWLAALSAVGFSLTPILAKKGLSGISPLFGGAISVTAGILSFSFFLLLSGTHRGLFRDPRAAFAFFALAGISNTLAIGLFYSALQTNLTPIVISLTSAFPLITILLSSFFLGKAEHMNLRVVAGALLIMGGTIVVFSYR